MWLFDEKHQKESLGEYGSGWRWDGTWPYVFDYEYGDGTPAKYDNSISTSKPSISGTWINYGSSDSKAEDKQCVVEITDGQMLVSGSNMLRSVSCRAHVYNTGNIYTFPATSASSPEPASRSICSKGWMLPQNGGNTSYSRLLEAYGIDYAATTKSNYDSGLVNLPLSYLRSGYYGSSGTLYKQGYNGNYRMASQSLDFHSGLLAPTNATYAGYGYSVRCVWR